MVTMLFELATVTLLAENGFVTVATLFTYLINTALVSVVSLLLVSVVAVVSSAVEDFLQDKNVAVKTSANAKRIISLNGFHLLISLKFELNYIVEINQNVKTL